MMIDPPLALSAFMNVSLSYEKSLPRRVPLSLVMNLFLV